MAPRNGWEPTVYSLICHITNNMWYEYALWVWNFGTSLHWLWKVPCYVKCCSLVDGRSWRWCPTRTYRATSRNVVVCKLWAFKLGNFVHVPINFFLVWRNVKGYYLRLIILFRGVTSLHTWISWAQYFNHRVDKESRHAELILPGVWSCMWSSPYNPSTSCPRPPRMWLPSATPS